MKKLFVILSISSFTTFSLAQELKKVIFDDDLKTPKVLVLPDHADVSPQQAISHLSLLLKTDNHIGFRIEKEQELSGNRALLRLKQTINEIDVFESYYNVHIENNKVKKFNGKYVPNITPQTANLNKEQAIIKALGYFNAQTYYWETSFHENLIKRVENNPEATYYPQPKLNYYTDKGEVKLCYVLDVYASIPNRAEKIILDAKNGNILNTISLLHDVDQHAVGISRFSDTVSFVTFETDSGFILRDYTRGGGVETYNKRTSTDPDVAFDFLHDDTIWDIRNDEMDEAALDAHWGAATTYDYFLEKHNRNSFNDNGAPLISFVHYGVNYSNAFWNGVSMTYGDGSQNGNPYLSIDIVGHELAHGVTGNSAQLIYQGESGALNESFSDIFGNAVEYYIDSAIATWGMGEQCFNELRDMANPNSFGDPHTYQGNYWASTAQGAFDNGGVHINSGVQNYWFYLLVEGGSGVNDNGDSYNVNKIGWELASEIAYRNLNEYLGVSSNYMDARDFSYEIAAEMFGDCSPEALNIIEAWYAVGVGNRLDAEVNPDFLLNYSYTCQMPMVIDFQNLTSEDATYTWDFGNGKTSSASNPGNIYDTEGEYNITLTATVNNACFTSTNSITKTLQVIEKGEPLPASCVPNVKNPSSSIGTRLVSLNGLYYESGLDDDDYSDNICKSNAVLHVDSSYTITILTSPSTKQNVRVWIDFNNDSTFTEDELSFLSNDKYGTHTGTINFSGISPVLSQPLRMRVISDIFLNNEITPCDELRFGQTEDYSIIMVDGDGTISSIKNNVESGSKVYPNPVANELMFTLPHQEQLISATIVDITGKEVISNINTTQVNTSHLDSGVYFIKIKTSKSYTISKFIKK